VANALSDRLLFDLRWFHVFCKLLLICCCVILLNDNKKTYRRMMAVDGLAFEMWYVDMLVQTSRCGHEYMHESAAVESPDAGLGRTTKTPAGDSFINLFIRTSVRGRRFSRGEGYVATGFPV
jgi:hypothetical protein